MIKLFTITYLFLSVFLSTAQAAKHIEAGIEPLPLAEFAAELNQQFHLPMTKGHLTWQLLTSTEDALVYTYTVGNSRNDIDISIFARTVRLENLIKACLMIESGVFIGLEYVEHVYKDYLGRDLYTLTLSIEDCV